METRDLLADAFGRIRAEVHRLLSGADEDLLVYRPDPDANSVAWLTWHLSRVMDNHVCEIADREEVWTTDGWAARFGLPFPVNETGYGHSSERVGQVRASAELLAGYHDAVQEACTAYLESFDPADLGRIIDTRWDPPVSVGVRLVSVISDCLQHVGQAAYVKGMYQRS